MAQPCLIEEYNPGVTVNSWPIAQFTERGTMTHGKISKPGEPGLQSRACHARATVVLILTLTVFSGCMDIAAGNCSSNVCQNGATCLSGGRDGSDGNDGSSGSDGNDGSDGSDGSYWCSCTPYFTGANCTEESFGSKSGFFYTPASVKQVSIWGDSLTVGPRDVWLNCTGVGSPPLTYKWTVNGTQVDFSKGRFTLDSYGTLRIKTADRNDEGIYQCFVSNEFGTEFSLHISLKFTSLGKFLSKSDTVVSWTVGRSLRLKCPPRSYSYGVSYRWIPSGHNSLIDRSRVIPLTDGDLLFAYVDEKDVNSSGIQCQMQEKRPFNDPVTANSGRIFLVKDGEFKGDFQPSLVSAPKDIHAHAGQDLGVRCIAEGRPSPNITWYMNGSRLEAFDGDNTLFAIFDQSLIFRLLNSAHEAEYKCVASNGVGSDATAHFSVKVGEKPKITSCGNDQIIADFGGSVTLTCETTGKPEPTRDVYRNGKSLLDSISKDRVTFPSKSTVKISHLRLEDNGTYQCVARNKFGSDVCSVFLVVTGSPLPPRDLRVTGCVNYTTTLSWNKARRTGIKPVKEFVIEYRARSRVKPKGLATKKFEKLAKVYNGNVMSHGLQNLHAYAEISFRMRAVNEVGASFPSFSTNPSLCMTMGRAPDKFPDNITVITPRPAYMLNISWEPLPIAKHNGPGCQYSIHYKETNKQDWNRPYKLSCDKGYTSLFLSRPHALYDVKVQVLNWYGSGPFSPIFRQFSGQNAPSISPSFFRVVGVTATTADVAWSPITESGITIDGYLVKFWEGEQCLECGDHGLSRRKRSLHWKALFNTRSRRSVRAPKFKSPEVLLRTALINHRRQKRVIIAPTAPPQALEVRFINTTQGTITGLKPYTSYVFEISGYNSGGMGRRSSMTSVSTLDTKISYYMMTLRLISETFTDDLRDMSSNKSLQLRERLEQSINATFYIPRRIWWFKGVKVHSFSPGSVQALMQIAASSSNMNDVQSVINGKIELGQGLVIDPNASSILSESIAIHISDFPVSTVQVGKEIVLNCGAPGAPREAAFTWLRNSSSLIGFGFRTKVQSGPGFSVLTIRDVMPEDDGQYSCYVSNGIAVFKNSTYVRVLPVVKISPRTATIEEGQSVTLSCSVVGGNITGLVLRISEKSADNVVSSSLTLNNVAIPNDKSTHTREFTCELWTLNNTKLLVQSESAKLVVVKAAALQCPEETKDGVRWSATVAGSSDVKPCPAPARGSASRKCLLKDQAASWGSTNFVNCASGDFIDLGSEAEALTEDFQPNLSGEEVLTKLANITTPSVNDSSKPGEIYGGDLEIAVNILADLAKYNLGTGHGKLNNQTERENFIRAASNLLERSNKKSWVQLDEVGKNTSNILVVGLDVYAIEVAESLSADGNGSKYVLEERNVVMRVDNVGQDNQIKKDGYEFAFQKSSIFLPSEVFQKSAGSCRVASFVYLTLEDIFLIEKPATFSRTDGSDDSKLPATSTIVSSTVSPSPRSELQASVKIMLENRKADLPSNARPKRSCAFWRVGLPRTWQTGGCRLVSSESNENITTCECDHLTVFASLMDPYGVPLPSEHKQALEIISIIGCSISALAVLLTVVVMLYFWKYIKSPRSKVLLNICAAVAITCILVICEGWARDNKLGCTIMAALLHYFLLAVFAWMLCEGILLYILLIRVFGGGAEDVVKYFYALGWGLPAIVVGVSLGVSQTVGYGTTEICWLSTDNWLIWAFVGPAIVVILVNLVIFILVIRQMLNTKAIQDKERLEKIRTGVRASAVILPLLGVTWIFGLLSFNSATLAFKYIFAIMNSLQGFMIFIFHCILNKQIRDAIKRKSHKPGSSTASNTQTNQIRNKIPQSDRGNIKATAKGKDHEMKAISKRRTLQTVLPSISQSFDSTSMKQDNDLMKVDVVIENPRKSDPVSKSASLVQPVQDLKSEAEVKNEPNMENPEDNTDVVPENSRMSITTSSSLMPLIEKKPEEPQPDAGDPGEELCSAHLENAPASGDVEQQAEGALLNNKIGAEEKSSSQSEKTEGPNIMVRSLASPRRISSSNEGTLGDEDFLRWMTKRKRHVDTMHEVGQRLSFLTRKVEHNPARRRWAKIRMLVVEGTRGEARL